MMATRSMSAIFVLATVFCVLTMPCRADQSDKDRQDWRKCSVAKHWCLMATTDAITHGRTRFLMLPAKQPFTLNHFQNRATLLIPCDDDAGVAHAFLRTDNSFSLGAIDIEYRIDPSGKIRSARAAHTGEGKMFSFAAAQLLVDDFKSGQTLTLRASRGGDSASFTETFDITGFDAAFIKLDCQLQ